MKPDFDDNSWPLQTASFGTMFWKLGPLPAGPDLGEWETRLAALRSVDPAAPQAVGTRSAGWTPYDFSWRWGVEGDPGHQGYHGLKESVSDEFIRLGRPKSEMTRIVREKEEGGSVYYLWTTVLAPRRLSGRLLAGGLKPSAVWLRGRPLAGFDAPVEFEPGPNPLLLRYDGPGSGWVLAVEPGFVPPADRPGALAMRWSGAPGILPFEAYPGREGSAELYRFAGPPGLKALTVTAPGDVEVWADGRPLQAAASDDSGDHAGRIRFVLAAPMAGSCLVALRLKPAPGRHGGAALTEPVEFECGEGRIDAGDWAAVGGLRSYSGGILYRKTVDLPAGWEGPDLGLDLGGVCASAEVFLNGRSAGVRVAPPWRWDIGALVRPGPNEIEVLVYNTLTNHYSTIPTRYRGDSASGLLGPVRLIKEKRP